MTRRARWWASAALLVVTIGACGGPPGDAGPPSPPPSRTPTTEPTPDPTWPLTGLPAPGGAGAAPVLVIKVDNTRSAAPQVGLRSADLVVQELVEGGMTRLAVMFHSTLPDEVVPVRSVRTSDIGLVLPTGGALVASGGAGRVLRLMDEAGVTVVQEGTAGFSRVAGRSAPYNVGVEPSRILAALDELSPPAQPYLPWAEADDALAGGAPVAALDATFSSAHTTEWAWDGEVWRRSEELAAEGDAFEPRTVLVLRVDIRDAGYRDPAGNFVPETVLDGAGEALLFADGRVIEGRWSKDAATAPFALADDAGDPLAVPPGRTWIALIPTVGGDVSWTPRQ